MAGKGFKINYVFMFTLPKKLTKKRTLKYNGTIPLNKIKGMKW
jgi:hypothetical protein